MNKLTAALLSRDVVLGNCHQIGNKGEFEECEMCQLSAQLSLTPSVAIREPLDGHPRWKAPETLLGDQTFFQRKRGSMLVLIALC